MASHLFFDKDFVQLVNSVPLSRPIGLPLTGSLSSWARSGFWELKNDGPNDGLSLLSDLIIPHGLTLVELGRDHFLLDDEIDVRTVALAITVIQWLQNSAEKLMDQNS